MPRAEETNHFWPQFLPDGRHFLYLAQSRRPEYDGIVYVGSLDSTQRETLFTADSHAVYVPQGYLLFMRSNTLVAQPFDADRLRVTGEPLPVAEQIEMNTDTRRGAFSVSPAGVLAFRPVAETKLMWVDRSGRPLSTIGTPGHYRNAALSPDEQRVAVARIDAETGAPDIWMIDARGVMSRLTSHPSLDDLPIWTSDGQHIVFKSSRNGRSSLYRMPSTGGGPDETVITASTIMPMDVSRGSSHLVYGLDDGRARFQFDLWRLPLSGDRKPIPVRRTMFNETQAQLSPDGRWIAYVSNDSGRNEINVSAFPSGDGKWQISTDGGVEPRWRGDGKELFFVALDQSLMAVPMTMAATVAGGHPGSSFHLEHAGDAEHLVHTKSIRQHERRPTLPHRS